MMEPTELELAERQNSYEAGYISGMADEQERIIALLEAEKYGDAAALIKGENK